MKYFEGTKFLVVVLESIYQASTNLWDTSIRRHFHFQILVLGSTTWRRNFILADGFFVLGIIPVDKFTRAQLAIIYAC